MDLLFIKIFFFKSFTVDELKFNKVLNKNQKNAKKG